MKRVILPVLTIALLLSACQGAGSAEKCLDEARESLAQAETISFTAEVGADLGDSRFEFTAECSYADGETEVYITSPELIAGITAKMAEGHSEMEYDGLILSLGDLVGTSISPVSSIPIIINALLGGFASEVWSEGDFTVARVYVDDSADALIWLDAELTPVRGEIVAGGTAAAQCSITNFTVS